MIFTKVCRVIAVTSALAGILFTLTFFIMAHRFGVASVFALCSVLPYILLLFLSKNANSLALTGFMSVLALVFACAGNYSYFNAIVINPSGSSGDCFFVITIVELIFLCPIFIYVTVKRTRSKRKRVAH